MDELYVGFGTILGTLSKSSELSGLFTCKALCSESYKYGTHALYRVSQTQAVHTHRYTQHSTYSLIRQAVSHTLSLIMDILLSVHWGTGLCVFTTITAPLLRPSPLNPDALRPTSQ